MNKLIVLIAAGFLASGALFAGSQGDGVRQVQNETKEMKMACSVPLGNLNLTAEQKEKMNAMMSEHHKTGCTEASEAKFMTPEQYAKFKAEYDRSPKMKM